MKQITSADIKQYVSNFSSDCEFGGMSESLAILLTSMKRKKRKQ